MCIAVAVAWSALPTELIRRHDLAGRIHERGGEREIQFHYQHSEPSLPVWRDGELKIIRWGNSRRQSRRLPISGWTWRKSIDDGHWRNLETSFVEIPAILGFDGGRWFAVRQGIRGLLVDDEHGDPAIYMICEPSSKYYQNMTKSFRMPVLIEEVI